MIIQTISIEQIIIRIIIIGVMIGAIVAWWIVGLIISVRIWGKHK
jgi:hypothetical protein